MHRYGDLILPMTNRLWKAKGNATENRLFGGTYLCQFSEMSVLDFTAAAGFGAEKKIPGLGFSSVVDGL